MKAYSFTLSAGRPVLLMSIVRVDGTEEHITSHNHSITIGSDTWVPKGGLRFGNLTQRNDGTLPSLGFEIQLTSNSPMTLANVNKGKYAYASAYIYLTNAVNPTVADFVFAGFMLGDVSYGINGAANFELVSYFAVPRDIFVRKYQLLCDADFGDHLRCKIPTFVPDVARSETLVAPPTRCDARRVRFAGANTPEDYANVYLEVTVGGTTAASAPAFSSTVGATTVDGTVTFTTRNAWVRAARIAAISGQSVLVLDRLPDARASGDNTWFHPGSVTFRSGEFNGRRVKFGMWDAAALSIETYLPIVTKVAVNDWVEIAPDCDHTSARCGNFYNNTHNYRGFDKQEGAKAQSIALKELV